MKNKDVVVIVPVYNESNRAIETIEDILRSFDGKVLVIDDGSFDNSYDLLKKAFLSSERIYIARHFVNMGKGSAMKTGIEIAEDFGAKKVIFVDSDGQHNPRLIPEFVEGLRDNDIVFGYRVLDGEIPFVRRWGNIVAKRILKVLFKVDRKEFLCGFMGFNLDIYDQIEWTSTRYGVETEIATKVARNNLSYKEIKIDTIYVDKYKGVTLLDAFKVLGKIPFWYFSK